MRRTFLTPECDNKTQAHLLVDVSQETGGMRTYCKLCNRTYYLKTNKNGAPDKRQYAKLYYRDIIQPNKPLYYRIHPEKMRLGTI